MKNHKKIEEAKTLLKSNGYQVDNLWSIEDVQAKFDCTDDEAYGLMYEALTNDATMEQVWLAIDIIGDIKGYTPVKND